MRRLCIYILVSLGIVISSEAQLSLKKQTPFVGAEVFIEPGQTPEEIDYWFRVLKDKGMDYCRIRMFDSYISQMVPGIIPFLILPFAAQKNTASEYSGPYFLLHLSVIWEGLSFRLPRSICNR